MKNPIYIYIAAVFLSLACFAGISCAQGSEGTTSISYDDATGLVTAYGDTTNDLDSDYASEANLTVYDQNGTVAESHDYELYDNASTSLQFAATPGSTYTAATFHCFRLQSWDYALTYPYHQFYYDGLNMSSFTSENIYLPLDYFFQAPGYPEIHRSTSFFCVGRTYDSVEAVPTLTISRNGTAIGSNAPNFTPPVQTVSVGEKIFLTTTVSRGTPSSKQWTIPGEKIAFFEGSSSASTFTALTDLGQTSIQYYWVDGGDNRTVQYSVTVNGKTYSANANFNVKRPSVTDLDIQHSSVGIKVHFGDERLEYGFKPSVQGVEFTATTNENGIADGLYQWVQVYNESKSVHLISASSTPVCAAGHNLIISKEGLDKTYPYGDNVYASGATTKPMNDSPDITLSAISDLIVVNDSASSWLMFNPNLTNSIWVPLKKVTWSWGGSVRHIPGDPDNFWEQVPDTTYSNPTPTATETTTFPAWTLNIDPHTYTCD